MFDRHVSSDKHQMVKVFVVLQYCLTVDMHKEARWNLIDAGIFWVFLKKKIISFLTALPFKFSFFKF